MRTPPTEYFNLIPTPPARPTRPAWPPHEQAQITSLTDFVVEKPKTARAHLKHLGITTPIRDSIRKPSTSTNPQSRLARSIAAAAPRPQHGFLLSEAGCPAVADPGRRLGGARARRAGFEVCPLVGPSSLLLALMASAPTVKTLLLKAICPPIKPSASAPQSAGTTLAPTQRNPAFIETPYRNDALLADAVATLSTATRLCTACDLTLPGQQIISQTIAQWRKSSLPDLKKWLTIFVLHAAQTRT